ncbi:HTH-type transcriptional regulator Hpr [Bacillus fonticola]|uniref:HTH-type transcriptional regulator Hpr n=1 Tax=Bacillus fonticola TaxID=2728853 RepID=UPI0014748215|nr:HTH-type transcriptional regulator Hpr [Bacillus fonticola]
MKETGVNRLTQPPYDRRDALLFSQRMAQLSKALWKAVEKDWQCWIKPFDLNLNEHHILWIAYHLGGASISDVAKFGVMHVSTAFNFSKKLEDRGLLCLLKRQDDKRNTYVQLTEEGEELLLKSLESYEPETNAAFSGALPLRHLYGKFPEFHDIMAILRNVYGDDFMEIFEKCTHNVTYDFEDRNGTLQKKSNEPSSIPKWEQISS